ncbi:MAG TPA: hypothetical protein VHV10_10850 [Ktedonobacteraceae bacterium]|jgi:uncharacterized membrane protein YfcA|nr:hypothetical protein [Ktedonobacteraceae bacterium]
MKHTLRLRIAIACWSCFIAGQFLGSFFVYQENTIGFAAIVVIPTFALFLYIAVISRQVQPTRKKKLPTRRNVRLVR